MPGEEAVGDLYPSPDGRLLLDVSRGVVTFRQPDTWKPTAYWLPVATGNTELPLVVAPTGLFDGDPANWKSLDWRVGTEPRDTLLADAVAEEWYRPGLLAEILSGRLPSPVDHRQPEVQISLSGKQPMFSSRSIDLAVRVNRAPAGARDLRLFRNGMLVKRWHGENQPGDPLVATVAVSSGKNTFTAYAFNRDNVKGADAQFVYEAIFPEARRTATIIAFGVNTYRDTSLNLRYAAPDATAFATDLKKALDATGEWDDVRAVPFLNQQVTRDSILEALGRLAEERPATSGPLGQIGRTGPSDAIFLFFAGHGITLGNRFYLVPHNVAASRTDVRASAVSDEDLELALESIDAREIVIVIDSCYSGQLLESEEARLGPLNARGLAHLAYHKGMKLLVAAQAQQQAVEASRLGHGVLTFALVDEGLGSTAREADTDPKNGVVDLSEWLGRAALRVPEIQSDILTGLGRPVTVEADMKANSAKSSGPQVARLYLRKGQARKAVAVVSVPSVR
jgi:hypothetical protein